MFYFYIFFIYSFFCFSFLLSLTLLAFRQRPPCRRRVITAQAPKSYSRYLVKKKKQQPVVVADPLMFSPPPRSQSPVKDSLHAVVALQLRVHALCADSKNKTQTLRPARNSPIGSHHNAVKNFANRVHETKLVAEGGSRRHPCRQLVARLAR